MKHALALIASAALLAACGGGGGDSPQTDTSNTQSFDVSGVAAKGLISGAIVTAHAVNSDGSIQSQALGTADAPTDAQGAYRIRFSSQAGQPVVLRVLVPAAGATHRDEVTGQSQALPPGFTMRAVIVPATAGTLSANITPFTEMAAEAAEDAGINATRAGESNTTIKQMLGITSTADLPSIAVRTTATASTPDEQRLAVMLTAVSQMAASGAVGCSTGTSGERAQCVVQALSDSVTSTTSFALAGQAAPALLTAVETVVNTPTLIASVPPSVVAPAIGALQCEATSCAAPPPVVAVDNAAAITATKTLFSELKTDILSLFGNPDSLDPGALEVENNKFGDAMSSVQVPVEMLAKDTGAILMGIDLYNDYKAGRVATPSRGRAPGEFIGSDGFGSTSLVNAAGCTLYQDSTTTTPASSPANANFIGCSAIYYMEFATSTSYGHGFTITPGSTAGSWSYVSSARPRRNGVSQARLAPVAGLATGTLTTTTDANGHIVTFSATGTLPGAFTLLSKTLESDSNQWSVSGTRTIDASNGHLSNTTMSGSVVAKDSAGATLGTLTIRSASMGTIPVASDAFGNTVAPQSPRASGTLQEGDVATATFDVLWTLPGAEFEGVFAATDSAWDKSLTVHAPTRLALEGRLSNIAGGVKTDFITGRLAVAATGFDQFDATALTTSTNTLTVNASFTGTVTAPNRPLLSLTVGGSGKTFDGAPATATLQYRSFNGTTARMAINVDASTGTDGVPVVTVTDTTHNISVSARRGAPSADVMLNGSTKIGTLDTATGVMTFTDGTFVNVTF